MITPSFGNVIDKFYIWCMKRMAPIPGNIECLTHIVRSNVNVVMYDVTMDNEIIGYFVGVNNPDPCLVELSDREAADDFFDKLDMRVAMAERGICLN